MSGLAGEGGCKTGDRSVLDLGVHQRPLSWGFVVARYQRGIDRSDVTDQRRGVSTGQRLADGDQQALLELYRRYGKCCYSLAFRVCSDAGMAEDAVLGAMMDLSAAKEASGADSAGSSGTVLMSVHRWAVDLVRAARIDSRRRDRGPSQGAEIVTPTEGLLGRDGTETESGRALNALPTEDRQALEMCFFDAYTEDDAANALGTSAATVRTRNARSIDLIRGHLESNPP